MSDAAELDGYRHLANDSTSVNMVTMLPNLLFIIFVFLSKSLSFNQIGV